MDARDIWPRILPARARARRVILSLRPVRRLGGICAVTPSLFVVRTNNRRIV